MLFGFLLALTGGLFAILTFIHFFVDWIFQSHAEAMVKHNNATVRAKHCAIYTLGFIPLLLLCIYFGALTQFEFIVSVIILFVSHFIEDTYLPVYLWAKYIRRPPEMTEPVATWSGEEYITAPNPREGFIKFVQTPLGKILMIAIDQIIHLTFLFPIVWMIVRHIIQGLFS